MSKLCHGEKCYFFDPATFISIAQSYHGLPAANEDVVLVASIV